MKILSTASFMMALVFTAPHFAAAQENAQEGLRINVGDTSYDATLSIVNGERKGHIELVVRLEIPQGSSSMPTLRLRADEVDASITPATASPFRLEMEFVDKFIDPNGKKRKVYSRRVLRAGPGEQISIGFNTLADWGNLSFSVMYFNGDGRYVGCVPVQYLSFSRPPQRSSKVYTFVQRDLGGSECRF